MSKSYLGISLHHMYFYTLHLALPLFFFIIHLINTTFIDCNDKAKMTIVYDYSLYLYIFIPKTYLQIIEYNTYKCHKETTCGVRNFYFLRVLNKILCTPATYVLQCNVFRVAFLIQCMKKMFVYLSLLRSFSSSFFVTETLDVQDMFNNSMLLLTINAWGEQYPISKCFKLNFGVQCSQYKLDPPKISLRFLEIICSKFIGSPLMKSENFEFFYAHFFWSKL